MSLCHAVSMVFINITIFGNKSNLRFKLNVLNMIDFAKNATKVNYYLDLFILIIYGNSSLMAHRHKVHSTERYIIIGILKTPIE